MRFANPPGIAAFMQDNVGYDEIGGRAIKDAVDQDLTTMGTMGQAQSTGLATIARDRAADLRREAQMYAHQQEQSTANTMAGLNAATSLFTMGMDSGMFGGGNGGGLGLGSSGSYEIGKAASPLTSGLDFSSAF